MGIGFFAATVAKHCSRESQTALIQFKLAGLTAVMRQEDISCCSRTRSVFPSIASSYRFGMNGCPGYSLALRRVSTLYRWAG